MTRLVERSLVKKLMGVALADTRKDIQLDAFIEQASAQVELITRRRFLKQARTEFYQSYEMWWNDPDPLYIHLNAFPVDQSVNLVSIVYADQDRHTTQGITLDSTQDDFFVNEETGVIRVRGASGSLQTQTVVKTFRPLFHYAPTGFKVTYTGGYAALTESAAAQATGKIRFTSNPIALDTISLNGSTWTFVASGATGNETNIAGTLALTIVQLLIDLNASVDAEVAKATYTDTVNTASHDLDLTFDLAGETGNFYRIDASGEAAGSLNGFTLIGGVSQDAVDPLDDVGVVQVPDGLQMIIAKKIVDDLSEGDASATGASAFGRKTGFLNEWSEEQRSLLQPYTKKDLFF